MEKLFAVVLATVFIQNYGFVSLVPFRKQFIVHGEASMVVWFLKAPTCSAARTFLLSGDSSQSAAFQKETAKLLLQDWKNVLNS